MTVITNISRGDVIIVRTAAAKAFGVQYGVPAVFLGYDESVAKGVMRGVKLLIFNETLQSWLYHEELDSVELVCKFKDVI